MLVRRIKEFTDALNILPNLMDYDSAILENLSGYFSSKDNDQPLNDADIKYIKNHFNQRCALIATVSDIDYTSNPTRVNLLYVALAKDLAGEQNISYLKILFPTLVNTQDPNDFSKLTNKPIDTLFWLGNAQGVPRILYSISGLANQVKQYHSLSTRREPLGPSCALTINELSQLRRFRSRPDQFSFEGKIYVNFWAFLEIEMFSKLNPPRQTIAQFPETAAGVGLRAADAAIVSNALAIQPNLRLYNAQKQLPAHLLSTLIPSLLFLTEQYFILRPENHHFEDFKSISKFIFRTINALNLRDINHIYGVQIHHAERKIYLLDLLIDIYNAKSFNIDDRLLVLRDWLAPFKRPLPSSTVPLFHFKTLILSLFLVEFTTLRPSLDYISLYDIRGSVFRNAKKLYSEVEGLIESNDLSGINLLFPQLINNYIKSFLDEDSEIITLLKKYFYESRVEWYKHVKNNTLSQLGIHWEEPELLVHVMVHPMLQLLSLATGTHSEIKIFLDELIRTYTLSNELINDLQRGFRVNILFNRLLKTIPENDKRSLYLLIDAFRCVHVKDMLISNCVRHMQQTIDSLSGPASGSAADHVFFRRTSHVRDTAARQPHNMREAADALKRPGLSHSAIMYLNKLTEPFLSAAVIDAINEGNATRVDSLGAPS